SRLVVVEWPAPQWYDDYEITSVESNYRSGDVFYWGDFHIVYTARDAFGSVGRCEFDLFVAPNQCATPTYDSDQGTMPTQFRMLWYWLRSVIDTLSDDVGSYFSASVKCKDPRFPLPGPQFYVCDTLGQWHRSVYSPTLMLPVCGSTKD
ncbi:hypothetical protein PFISCL1PPCAC_9519, partial [Pristionchus fissidentatus]